MPIDTLAHLKELTTVPGLSGYEGPTRAVIRRIWEPLATEIHVDALGSLWATKTGTGAGVAKNQPRPKIMLGAHMDAIGLMVKQIDGEFLRVTSVGGIDGRIMPGQLVTVHGREDLPGVVARPPSFLLLKSQRDSVVPPNDLLVDVGLPADRVKALVKVSDVISFAQAPMELQGGLLAARSLDNRASVAAVTVCLDALQSRQHVWDVVAVATVQEEVGLRGAITSAFAIQPDLAIALDVTFGSDGNTREFSTRTYPIGEGPTLGLGPNVHTGLHHALKATAERAEIPFQIEVMANHSGTDGFAFQVSREGIPSMVIGLPLRNMHSAVEVIHVKDVTRAGRWLAEFISELDAGFMSALKNE